MEKHEALAAIRKELIALYGNEQTIRRVLQDVNIDPSRVAAGTSVENYWAEAITEAAKHKRIDNIVAVAIKDYPSKKNQLTWLLQEYYAATKDSELSSSNRRSCSIVMTIGFLVIVLLFVIALQDNSVKNDIRSLAQSLRIFDYIRAIVVINTPSPPNETATATLATISEALITTPIPQTIDPVVSLSPTSRLCEFALSVLDRTTERPISRAEVIVTIGQQQTTGISDSTGYFRSRLPCQDPFSSANVRITAAGYDAYKEKVVLVGEVKEVLLMPIAEQPTTPPITTTVTEVVALASTATPVFATATPFMATSTEIPISTTTATSTATQRPKSTATPIPTATVTPAPRSCPDTEGMAFVAGSNFCMDVTEVTNGDYQKCVEKGSCTAPSDDLFFSNPEKASYPVVYVTWDQAYAYCRDVLKRLPSSTEWQEAYAALNDENATLKSTREYSPVMSNPWDRSTDQIFDLHGNVREWADDNFINPGGIKSINKYVMGDSFQSIQFPNESHAPETIDRGIGFRCVAYAN